MTSGSQNDFFLSCLVSDGNVIKLDIAKWNSEQKRIRERFDKEAQSDKEAFFKIHALRFFKEPLHSEKKRVRRVDCSGAIFAGDVHIECCFIDYEIDFSRCHFLGGVNFCNTLFGANALFVQARFDRDALFFSTAFAGEANFMCSEFSGDAAFYSSIFIGAARFYEAIFKKVVSFRKYRSFVKGYPFQIRPLGSYEREYCAEFYSDARFQSIQARDANFVGTVFHIVPSLHFYNFQRNPLMQNVQINITVPALDDIRRLVRERLSRITRSRYDGSKAYFEKWISSDIDDLYETILNEATERFRTLKLLAIEGNSHLQVLKFRAGEIIANRHIYRRHSRYSENSISNTSVSNQEYWLGRAYECFSNFGMSFAVPFFWLICLISSSTGSLWATTHYIGTIDAYKCATILDQVLAALGLVLEKTLLGYGFIGDSVTKELNRCIFSTDSAPLIFHILSLFHSLLSIILWFLIAFGMRNVIK